MRRLQTGGYRNIVTRVHAEFDLTNLTTVENLFDRERSEYVFLASAKVDGILANNTYPADFISRNLMIQANVIHASHKYGVRKLFYLGSSCIYPRHAPQPMKEEYFLTGQLEPTNEPNAIAKVGVSKFVQCTTGRMEPISCA